MNLSIRLVTYAVLAAFYAASVPALPGTAPGAEPAVVRLLPVHGNRSVGTITFTDTEYGMLIIPDLTGLEPGLHAAHVHENGDCRDSPDGTSLGAAGDHYDPGRTGRHAGPYGDGHLGDLPNLVVEVDRRGVMPVLAPRVRAVDIRGRALILHAGADRYDAHATHSHGTGGDRAYCGIIG